MWGLGLRVWGFRLVETLQCSASGESSRSFDESVVESLL